MANKKLAKIHVAAMAGIIRDTLRPEKEVTEELVYELRDQFRELLSIYDFPTPGKCDNNDV